MSRSAYECLVSTRCIKCWSYHGEQDRHGSQGERVSRKRRGKSRRRVRGAPVGEPEESADGTRLQEGPRSRSLGRAGWALPRTLREQKGREEVGLRLQCGRSGCGPTPAASAVLGDADLLSRGWAQQSVVYQAPSPADSDTHLSLRTTLWCCSRAPDEVP